MTSVGSRVSELQARSMGMIRDFATYAPTQTRNIDNDTSTGGSFSVNRFETEVSTDGTDGEHATTAQPISPFGFNEGVVIVWAIWSLGFETPDGASAEHHIGLDNFGGNANQAAFFRPNAGINTSGNVRVVRGGSNSDGQIDYGNSVSQASKAVTAIVVDFDNGTTEFYLNKNPLADSPNETINEVPATLHAVGGTIRSNGSDSGDQLQMSMSGWVIIP